MNEPTGDVDSRHVFEQRLYSLISATQSMSALDEDMNPKRALQGIVEAANEVLGADLSVILPYRESTDQFLMGQVVAAGSEVESYTWLEPEPGGVTRQILDQGQLVAVTIEDVPEEWRALLGTSGFGARF